MTTIGIIGAGAIGSAFATALASKGIEAVIANSRGPESLRELTDRLGPTVRAGSGKRPRRRTAAGRRWPRQCARLDLTLPANCGRRLDEP